MPQNFSPKTETGIVIYYWQCWPGFLLSALVPNATFIQAVPGEDGMEAINRMPQFFHSLVFHLSVSLTSAFPLRREGFLRALQDRNATVINKHITDVTKQRIQQACKSAGLPNAEATPDCLSDQKLIVKTNYNYGAESERGLPLEVRTLLGLTSVSDVVPNAKSYQVLSRRDIPDSWWDRSDLCVERYIENPEDLFFRVYVAGRNIAVSRVIDPQPIKKMPAGIERQTSTFKITPSGIKPVAEQFQCSPSLLGTLFRFVTSFQLDFGALDVVFEPPDSYFVIDVNNTPHWGKSGHPELLQFLREGLLELAISPPKPHRD